MPINPRVVEAANADGDIAVMRADGSEGRPYAESRARRVLLAQAGCVSDGMVGAAVEAYRQYVSKHGDAHSTAAWSHAIAAALRFEAGDEK